MIGGIPASLRLEFPHPFTTKKRTTFRIGHRVDPLDGSQLSAWEKRQAKALINNDSSIPRPADMRGPKVPVSQGDTSQLRVNAEVYALLKAEFPELTVLGGGRAKGTLQVVNQEKAIKGVKGVRSPDFTLEGQLTPELATRLQKRISEVVSEAIGGRRVGDVLVYGVPAEGAGKVIFPINIGKVEATTGTPLGHEYVQQVKYQQAGVPFIHVSSGIHG
jgi:hypothetical protein